MKRIIKQSFDEERALYNLTDAEVINCRFAGLAAGESVLKGEYPGGGKSDFD